MTVWLRKYWRWIALGLGVLAVTLLVRKVGPARVFAVMLEAGPWLPVILLLEATWLLGSDVLALRVLSAGLVATDRRREVPLLGLLRATILAYAFSILAPAGRAAGEVARGAFLSRYLGAARAAVTGGHMHAAGLFGNALACLLAFVTVAVTLGPVSMLALFVLGNVVVVGTMGVGVVSLTRSPKVGTWLASRAARFGVKVDPAPGPTARGRAIGWGPFAAAVAAVFGGRCLQAVQYGVVLHAVGGTSGLVAALTAHAVNLVGANMGDLVPGQMGVTETSYSAFADALGFGDAPARALSIPLLVRVTQLTLAIVCMAIAGSGKVAAAKAAATAEP